MRLAVRVLLPAMMLALAGPAAAEPKAGFAPLARAQAPTAAKVPQVQSPQRQTTPENPVELVGTGTNAYLVPPEKRKPAGEGENEGRGKPTAQDLAEQQQQREKAALQAEADKVTSTPRALVFRAEGTSENTVPVPTIGEPSAVLQQPVGRFTLPIKAETNLLAGLGSLQKHNEQFTGPAEARGNFSSLAHAPRSAEAVAAAPALQRVASLDQATGKSSFDLQPAVKNHGVEVMALSTTRPFGAIARDTDKPAGLSVPQSADHAPVAPLARAVTPVEDLYATP